MLLSLLFGPVVASAARLQGVLAVSGADMTTDLRLMSFNVRYDSEPDDISVQQSLDRLSQGVPSAPTYYGNATEQPWSLRRLYIANDIVFNNVDLFGNCVLC